MSEKTEQALQFMLAEKNCCQSTLSPFAKDFGFDPEDLQKLTAGFGGGIQNGDSCGAITGGMMVLGMAFGDDPELLAEKQAKYREMFNDRFGSPYCVDLLGVDVAIPGAFDEAWEKGIPQEKCPVYVTEAVAMLEKLLEEDEKEKE